jgi:hypothetical protein
MSDRPGGEGRQVVAGIALTFGLHLAAIIVLIAIAAVSDEAVMFGALFFFLLIGVSQFVYMIPAIIIAYRRGRRALGKGLIIGAAITFILSGACWAGLGSDLAGGLFRGRPF